MYRFTIVAAISCSFAVGLYSEVEAARICRPARRYCVGVTHQPCAPACVRAPRCQEAVTEYSGCACAFQIVGQGQGFYYYYGVDFRPNCYTGYPVMMTGNFNTSNSDPCPSCPANQCVGYTYYASHSADRKYFKPGTKLDKRLQWDEKLVLNSGTAKIKSRNGTERTVQIESRELNDSKMLVSFSSGNSLYFAKLHVCRIEATEADGKATVSDFGVGQEIEPPPSEQKVRDVTSQVTILDSNVANISIGNTTYQVLTATRLQQ